MRREQNAKQELTNGARLAVLTDKEQVLGNRSTGMPMPNYGHERGGERGIEQGAMSEGRVQFGVWLTTGRSGEQKRTHQQHIPVLVVRISCVKCARVASDQVEHTGLAWSAHAIKLGFPAWGGQLGRKTVQIRLINAQHGRWTFSAIPRTIRLFFPTTVRHDQASTATPAPPDRVRSG